MDGFLGSLAAPLPAPHPHWRALGSLVASSLAPLFSFQQVPKASHRTPWYMHTKALVPLESHVFKPAESLRRKSAESAEGNGGAIEPEGLVPSSTFKIGDDILAGMCDPTLSQVLFRIVDWQPSRFRVVRSRGGVTQKVSSQAVAVSLHDSGQVPGQPVIVGCCSAYQSTSCMSPIMVLQSLHKNLGEAGFDEYFLAWQAEGADSTPLFSFRGCLGRITASSVATLLVERKAWSEGAAVLPPVDLLDECIELTRLEFLGRIGAAFQDKFYITEQGGQSMHGIHSKVLL